MLGHGCEPQDFTTSGVKVLNGCPACLCAVGCPAGGHWFRTSPGSSVPCPAPAAAGPKVPEKVAPLRRIPGPSLGHRKWWLGEGRQWEGWQEGRGCSQIPERPLPSKAGRPSQAEMNAWKWSSGPRISSLWVSPAWG